jgi:hypothetical protein
MVRRIVVVAVVAVSLAAVGTHLTAQQSTPKPATAAQATAAAKQAPQPASATPLPRVAVTIVQIKPDLVDEWLEFQKNETIPTLRKGGVTGRTGLVTAFGESFEYVFLTPLTSFAERDGESPIVKALGQDGARAFAQKNRRFIAHQRTFVATVRPDLSYQPTPAASLPIAVVSSYSIATGHNADFESYIKNDLTPAHKQLKTGGFVVQQALFGGDGNSFVVATLLSNFAEIDKGPAVTRAYGQARAAAIQQKLAGIVTHVERTVVRMMPELSFQPRSSSDDR